MLLLKNATVYPQTEKAPFMGDVRTEGSRRSARIFPLTTQRP